MKKKRVLFVKGSFRIKRYMMEVEEENAFSLTLEF